MSRLAVAALVTGLLAACLPPLALVSIPCGILALIAIDKAKGALTGKRVAIAGLTMGYIVTIALIGVLSAISASTVSRALESWRAADCQNNLKQMGLVFRMYAKEHKDYLPNLSPIAGNLTCDRALYPEWLVDPNFLVCPNQPLRANTPTDPKWRINDRSYFYLGYCLTNDAEVASFVEAYLQACKDPAAFNGDLKVQPGKGSFGSDTLYHLREGVDRLYIRDINLTASVGPPPPIPVMVERSYNHAVLKEGGNVLFLDGHVEFIRYGHFPMTEATITALESLSASKAQ